MANERVIEIPPQSFGYGNQALIGQSAGGDQSFFQSIRQHCAPGTHSIDRRQPCSGCEPGSFAETHGTLTNYTYSFDQSVKHPYTLLQTLTYIDDRRMSCKPCPAGSFASSPGQGYCDECQAGSYTFSGASTCHNCAPGTYANSTGSGNCALQNSESECVVHASDCKIDGDRYLVHRRHIFSSSCCCQKHASCKNILHLSAVVGKERESSGTASARWQNFVICCTPQSC